MRGACGRFVLPSRTGALSLIRGASTAYSARPVPPSATSVDGSIRVATLATRLRPSSPRGHCALPVWTTASGLSLPDIRHRPARASPSTCYRRGRLPKAAARLQAQAQVLPAWTASTPLQTARHVSRRATTVAGCHSWRTGPLSGLVCYHHGQSRGNPTHREAYLAEPRVLAGKGPPWTVCATSMDSWAGYISPAARLSTLVARLCRGGSAGCLH
jgi:hypothetical protein